MPGTFSKYLKDPVWFKVVALGSTLFFILLADAILSFWVPNFVEGVLKSSILMGLILSFSSVVGFGADIFLPQILKGITVRKLLLLAIGASFIFILLLFQASLRVYIIPLLAAMGVWGLYYEFLGFAQQQFVADATPLRLHSTVWGLLTVFKSTAYFAGPLIATSLFAYGIGVPLIAALVFLGLGLLIFIFNRRGHDRKIEVDTTQISLIRELEHWKALFKHIWPVVLLSLFMGLVDSFFWTTGAVYTEKLAENGPLGKMFLPVYSVPPLFTGFIIARLHVVNGKKKLAETLTLLASIALIELIFFENVFYIVLMAFIASTLMWLAMPLMEATYSDVISRMGCERRHLIGLTNSSISVSYIIGPVLAGIVASALGEKSTFVFVGIIGVVLSVFLLFTTPKKLHLPQNEIKNWKD